VRRLLFHAPAVGGHHSTFIRYLIEACAPGAADIQIGFVVPQQVRDQPELLELAAASGVQLFLQAPERGITRHAGPLLPWLQVRRALREFRATRVTFLYGDGILNTALPLQLPVGCPVSAIVFRSTIHYAAAGFAALTPSETLRAKRQLLALSLAQQHRELAELFWLDPFGAEYMSRLNRTAQVGRGRTAAHSWLPDPVELVAPELAEIVELRRSLGIPDGRRVYLLFGPPNERKGTEQTLMAFLQMPEAQRLHMNLLIVGKATPDRRRELAPLIQQVRSALHGALQWVDEVVPEAAVPGYFALADVVLVPYQRHVGSSGVLLRAAGAGKPVIASDYGLVGAWTRQNGLGAAVDCALADTLAAALLAVQTHGVVDFDAAATARFAEKFSKTEFTRRLLGQGS
jgi:glycosyltransferase involved in cell wall biosynthesis